MPIFLRDRAMAEIPESAEGSTAAREGPPFQPEPQAAPGPDVHVPPELKHRLCARKAVAEKSEQDVIRAYQHLQEAMTILKEDHTM